MRFLVFRFPLSLSAGCNSCRYGGRVWADLSLSGEPLAGGHAGFARESAVEDGTG